jgi:anaerobic dimethyl sulfoxide reductase subunit B (iron-sulfur subunit)
MPKQYGFIIDRDRCVDCRACMTACKSANDVELGIAWRRVTTTWKGAYPDATFRSTSMACNHCARPACVEACPAAAISKRAEDGIVVVDKAKCTGCRSCERACPYHAPQYGKDGIMQKCDLCLSRISVGSEPACVATCPAGALLFGTMDELPRLAGKKTVVQLEGATRPSVFVPVPGA